MNDRLSASWILVVGSILVAYFYYKSNPKGNSSATGKGVSTTDRVDPSKETQPSGPVKDTGQEWFPWPKKQFEKIDEGIRKGKIKPVPGWYRPEDLQRMKMGYTPPIVGDLIWEAG